MGSLTFRSERNPIECLGHTTVSEEVSLHDGIHRGKKEKIRHATGY